jgi:hypothetical protein
MHHAERAVHLTVAIQLVIVIIELAVGKSRPSSIYSNPTTFGIMSLALFPYGFILAGLSLSRTALLVSLILTLINPTRKIVALCLIGIVIHLTLGFVQTPERYTLTGILSATDLRLKTISGTSDESVPSSCGRKTDVTFRWYGYGLGNYCEATGRLTPHNIFALIFWELGVFGLSFVIACIWYWYICGRNMSIVAFVIISGIFTHEILSTLPGIYAVALIAKRTSPTGG